MSSQQEITSFTLSFSGVNFCLEPSTDGINSDVLSIAKVTNDQVVIDFSNFSGVLRVTKGATNNVSNSSGANVLAEQTEEENQPMEVEAPKNDAPSISIPDAVPEEIPSPEPKEEEKPKKKGQQTLNFFSRKGDAKAQTSKRSSEQVTVQSSRKKTRSSIEESFDSRKQENEKVDAKQDEKVDIRQVDNKEEDELDEPDDDSSTEIEESQNTKFTMASLGQDMPSQESSQAEEAAPPPAPPVENQDPSANMDALDHDNFSFNLDSIPEDDYSFKQKLTPLKNELVEPGSLTPCPRWGQTMTMIDHRRLVVYGGQTINPETQTAMPLSDLFVFDLMDASWSKPINCEGIARTWHSANFLPEKQLLLCFGGDVVENDKTTTTDQVMVLDTEIMLWYPPTVTGTVPSGRSGHTASLLGNELVVFGGVKNGKWLNSVSVLDTGRWKWSTPKIMGDAPRPRSYHSATSLNCDDGRIVIFGGNNDKKCFNCVHVLEQINGKMTWSHPKVSGKAPSPRTGHTATLLDDGYTIMIYGGWDPNTEDEKGDDLIFGDSFLLDTKAWTWKKGPKPKFAALNGANVGNGGLERVGHSAVLAPGGEGVQVLAFGGRLRDGFAEDFQSLMVAPPQVQRDASRRFSA